MAYKIRKHHIIAWKRREGRSSAWLAARVGLKPASLSEQLNGRCGVSLAVALRLEAELGIPIRDLVEEVGQHGRA